MKKKLAFSRIRDWKGYGIAQQCGTCEPLQSPTSSKRTCKAERARSFEFAVVSPLPFREETGGGLILHNGQISILCGDKTYTLTGQEVK